ncbi:MAG: YraN family protein [Chromatocurvus sp.]
MAKETDGYYYEGASCQWLARQSCRVLTRNYRCRAGEIDLVVRDGDMLVFVEVRVRTNPRFASAAASVDRRKQQRLLRAAAHYLQRHFRGTAPPCRFDVVVWEPAADSGKLQPRWIRNAFSAS